MEEKKVEEILQDEEIPVTEEASGEGDAVQAQDPETETAESDEEAVEADTEETEEVDPEEGSMKIIPRTARKAFSADAKRPTRKRQPWRKRSLPLRTA